MPRDGTSTYTLPSPPAPFLPGQLASATDMMTVLSDIEAGLNPPAATPSSPGFMSPAQVSKLQSIVQPEDFNATGNLVVDDLAAVNAAISAAGWLGIVYLRGRYWCSAAPSNPRGVIFEGPGQIWCPSPWNPSTRRRRWDQRFEPNAVVDNEIMLGAVSSALRAAPAGTIFGYIGDSTTAGTIGGGTWLPGPEYDIHNLVRDGLTERGYPAGTHTNHAQPGVGMVHIRTVQIPAAVAAASHCIFLRPGHNDIGLQIDFTSEKSWTQIVTILEYLSTQVRGAIDDIQATLPDRRTTIVLMTPNSATMEDGRSSAYYEGISRLYRQIAYEKGCVFFDTYRMFQRVLGLSQPQTGSIADVIDYFTSPSAGEIHPRVDFNLMIAKKMVELIANDVAVPLVNYPRVENYRGGVNRITASLNPSQMTAGVKAQKALTVNGWPYTGGLLSFNVAESGGYGLQFNLDIGEGGSLGRIMARGGGPSGWQSWLPVRGCVATTLTLKNGWTIFSGQEAVVRRSSAGAGLSNLWVPGTVTAGTELLNVALPVDCRPALPIRFPVACDNGIGVLNVTTAGQVTVGTLPAGAAWVDVSSMQWLLT
jgi:hypothetical protein